MELDDLEAIHAQYPAKVRYLEHPDQCHDLLPRIAEINAKLAAISDDELRAFLAQVNRNPKNIAWLTGQSRRLNQVVAREQACLDETHPAELGQLLTQDLALFQRICHEIQSHYTRSVHADVIGYGEITTSLVLCDSVSLDSRLRPQHTPSRWVCKSLPKFPTMDEYRRYERAFYQYIALLHQAGLDMPEQKLVIAGHDGEGIKVYVVQRRLDSSHIGSVLIRSLDQPQALALLNKIALKIGAVFAANLESQHVRLALDGQISNWHCLDTEPATPMLYIDTSTPLFRVDGQEQLNPEIFLKNTPSFLRAVIRRFFLQDVLDRYYDCRSVLIDLIANLYKERRADLVGPAVETVNELIGHELRALGIAPLTHKEIEAYYREDAFIWRFFQTARRIDRFITVKILHKPYPFHLPERIER